MGMSDLMKAANEPRIAIRDPQNVENIVTLEARDMSGSIKTTWGKTQRNLFKISDGDLIIVEVLQVLDSNRVQKYPYPAVKALQSAWKNRPE